MSVLAHFKYFLTIFTISPLNKITIDSLRPEYNVFTDFLVF